MCHLAIFERHDDCGARRRRLQRGVNLCELFAKHQPGVAG